MKMKKFDRMKPNMKISDGMKRIYIAMSSVLALMLASCASMDITPKSQGNSESWYSTELELKMAANEFYILGYWNKPFEDAEQWTDNFTYRNTNRHPDMGALLDGNIDGTSGYAYTMWQQCYKLVSRANSMIYNSHRAIANGVSPDVVKRYVAEAYFCRACKYSELISYYGDVPYMDGLLTISEAEAMGRMPKAELIPLVYADFDKAIEGLPVDYGNEAVHATKGAAYAMKARFALYMGDWETARDAAKACMDLNVYELAQDYSEIFLQNTKMIPEKIFVIPRSRAAEVFLDVWFFNNDLPRVAGGYAADNPSWDLLACYLCTDGKPIDESELFDPRNPFKNRDPRCTKTIVEFGTRHVGYDYNPRMDVLSVMNYNTGSMVNNVDNRANPTNAASAQYASYNGLVWKKGIDDSWMDCAKEVETDYIIMRYADVLLMYAEAKIELGEIDDDCIGAINMVRERAYNGAPVACPAVAKADQETMRRTVRLERRVELAKENLRYMDLIRWGLYKKALNRYNYINLEPQKCLEDIVQKDLWFWAETPDVDEDGLADFSGMFSRGYCSVGAERVFPDRQVLWPIPTHDRLLCPNLSQNEGY